MTEETGNSDSYQTYTEDKENQGRQRRHGGGPLMQVLDINKHLSLSADEISNASTTLLILDNDKDGMVSLSELRPEKSSSKQKRRQH